MIYPFAAKIKPPVRCLKPAVNGLYILLVAGVALLVQTILAESENVDEVEPENDVEEVKEKFLPSKFVVPHIGNSPKPYLYNYFPLGSKLGSEWVKSTAKKDGVDADIAKYNGEWDIAEPRDVTIEGDAGLIVKTKARHHAIAAKLDRPFVFGSEPLIVQYDVKYEEGQECGGGYLKLLAEGAEKDLASFQDKTPYTIMFGPDKCGASGKSPPHLQVQEPQKNGSIDEYHAKQPTNPSGEYGVNVDGKSLYYGNILNDDVVPSLTPPQQVSDPKDKKPEDWDERPEIEDVTATKPADWDEKQPREVVDESATKPSDWLEEEPELIPDPDAVKPADWDSEMDGEWEPPSIDNPVCKGLSGCGVWKPPTIPNPKYKGKWVRPKITNPLYKGVWKARLIDNPDFFEPTATGGLLPITAVGIEMWTMSENIVFDNFLITSSEEQAKELATQTFSVKQTEEARFAKATGDGGNFVQKIIEAANERPWLWAVYLLAIIIPVVFLGVLCFGRKSSSPSSSDRKKTDAYAYDDDEVPNLIGEEIQEDADIEEIPGDEPPKAQNLRRSSRLSTATEPSTASSEVDDEGESDDDSDSDSTAEKFSAEEEPVQPTEEVAQLEQKKENKAAKRRTARRE
ncbi:unnamed protein product [Caenorhabditis auriculariae]|uniref:Calnexin n=1 Tax=Caenorhabditis auriculariae TaxID=2777116 RepID=A0A8S1GXK9_9PELO|nr:unnamed protein product [Caenorhabditis auriculariae]